jgi:hypothetical protein
VRKGGLKDDEKGRDKRMNSSTTAVRKSCHESPSKGKSERIWERSTKTVKERVKGSPCSAVHNRVKE